MVRRHIPKEYKDIALHLSLNEGLPDLQIQAYMGISPRSMTPPDFEVTKIFLSSSTLLVRAPHSQTWQ